MDPENAKLLKLLSIFIAVGFLMLGALVKVQEVQEKEKWEEQFQYFYQRYLEETEAREMTQ